MKKKKIKVKLGGQTSSALWFSRSPFVFPCSTVRCGGRKGQRREWRAVVGEKATAGIIAPVGGPHTVGLTCLPAYSAFSSDNAGSPTVRKHEMFSHTCWERLRRWRASSSFPGVVRRRRAPSASKVTAQSQNQIAGEAFFLSLLTKEGDI